MRIPPNLRWVAARSVSCVVDRCGGMLTTLPSGRRTRVATLARGLGVGYEAAVVSAFLNELRPDMHVADVGAHWGVFTLMAAPLVEHVVAFEASQENAKILARNVHLSGDRNVSLDGRAVMDHSGTVTFHDYRGPYWGCSMMSGAVPLAFTHPRQTLCTTLDASGARPDLIKIDVEGAEMAVLEGASGLIAARRPTIIVEVHHRRLAALGSSADAVRDLLGHHEYAVSVIDEAVQGDGERVAHWLCVAGGDLAA